MVAQLCRSLRRLYPHLDEVPTPLSSHMTRWTSEDHILGAMTHLPLGTEGCVYVCCANFAATSFSVSKDWQRLNPVHVCHILSFYI